MYSYILDEIAQRRIFPESRLAEERYARACGVSRSPVRLALRRLEQEGVVTIAPGKGATVRSPSAEEVRQVLELRREIEGFIAAAAAPQTAPADVARLREIVARERQHFESGDRAGLLREVFAFHTSVGEIARYPLAAKFLRELLMRSNVYHLFFDSVAFESPKIAEQHAKLVDALAAGDVERSRELAREHVGEMLSDHMRGIADRFRAAFRRHSTTVTVLTYYDAQGRAAGLTATAVSSLSADPPSLVASLNRASRSRTDIVTAGKFGVNVLGLAQEAVARHCSQPGGDKVLSDEWLLPNPDASTPVLRHALAHLDCKIARVHEEYTHSLIVAEVQRVWLGNEGTPLIYAEGAYRTLDAAAEKSYEAAWERVMSTFL